MTAAAFPMLPAAAATREPPRLPAPAARPRVVIRRRAGNNRLTDACRWWAFAALSRSPGVRAGYDARRAAGDGHHAALRRVASRLLGQLYHCRAYRQPYHEEHAWTPAQQDQQLV
jgi:hypothetical protein